VFSIQSIVAQPVQDFGILYGCATDSPQVSGTVVGLWPRVMRRTSQVMRQFLARSVVPRSPVEFLSNSKPAHVVLFDQFDNVGRDKWTVKAGNNQLPDLLFQIKFSQKAIDPFLLGFAIHRFLWHCTQSSLRKTVKYFFVVYFVKRTSLGDTPAPPSFEANCTLAPSAM